MTGVASGILWVSNRFQTDYRNTLRPSHKTVADIYVPIPTTIGSVLGSTVTEVNDPSSILTTAQSVAHVDRQSLLSRYRRPRYLQVLQQRPASTLYNHPVDCHVTARDCQHACAAIDYTRKDIADRNNGGRVESSRTRKAITKRCVTY